MTTRRDFHGHSGIMNRLMTFRDNLVEKFNANTPLLPTRLKFGKWKCEPLGCGQIHVITTCNNDSEESLRGLELINGKIVEMVKISDDEYRVKFDNMRMYNVIKYL